jgi:O-antigen/teichoic acid export membrane protein
MNSKELFSKFSQGVNWNAFLYFIYKISATLLTFLLYNKLDSKTFSTFANLNAIIFLVLLWIDFGFQKSIARFCPEYAQNSHDLKTFISSLLRFKSIVLVLALPIYLIVVNQLSAKLHLSDYRSYFYAGAGLVLLEGLISVIRLIYHAYFWQKQFNSMNAITLMIEVICDMSCIIIIQNQYILLAALIASKTISRAILLLLASIKLPKLYTQIGHNNNKEIHVKALNKRFAVHSAIMWFNTNIKSLTERNVLVPLFTHIFGTDVANIFKIANDGALLFYRIVIKSIGTTDTALFAHVYSMKEGKQTWQIAFKKLTTKIAALVLPLLGIVFVLYRYKLWFKYDQYVFQIFLLICICLLIEVMFSPYERILEVNRRYVLLTYAYTPYIIMTIILLTTNIMTYIGLFNSITLIHGVRLVSSFLMFLITRMRYRLTFPIRYVCTLSLSIYIGIYMLDKIMRYVIEITS